MHRFWMDRDEVTVERWRAARARGFVPPDATPSPNELRYANAIEDSGSLFCTYSARPLPGAASRERFPVTCVSWYDARAFCQFEGGDLPSEAQWEYAAIRAGRPRTVLFPWSTANNESVDCDRAVFNRHPAINIATCGDYGFGVVSIDDPVYAHDVTPLGLRSLTGNAAEWVLDAWAPTLGTACWQNATIVDPLCWEREALTRSYRGGDALDSPADILGGRRRFAPPLGTFLGSLGLRCVYAEAR
jgi:formylglycine-generating enzyme required for sulfatase activity